jgi:hypothetical protein
MTRISILTHLAFAALIAAITWQVAVEHTQLREYQANEGNTKLVALAMSGAAMKGK